MNGSTAANGGGMKKDATDLIIGSWNDEDAEKVNTLRHITPYFIIHISKE